MIGWNEMDKYQKIRVKNGEKGRYLSVSYM